MVGRGMQTLPPRTKLFLDFGFGFFDFFKNLRSFYIFCYVVFCIVYVRFLCVAFFFLVYVVFLPCSVAGGGGCRFNVIPGKRMVCGVVDPHKACLYGGSRVGGFLLCGVLPSPLSLQSESMAQTLQGESGRILGAAFHTGRARAYPGPLSPNGPT